MMLKTEEDDGYCSRSSLDSPIHVIKVETNLSPAIVTDIKEEDFSNGVDGGQLSSHSYLEVMLTRDDRKKPEETFAAGFPDASGLTSKEVPPMKSVVDKTDNSVVVARQVLVDKVPDKEFQPRKMIKLMPSSSQNLLLFTKQSALSGLVVSSKPSTGFNPASFHSLIKNDHQAALNATKKNTQANGQQSAEIPKSKNSHSNATDAQKKLHSLGSTQCHKKVVAGKGSNNSLTSARTGQPYVRNSFKSSGWGGRSCPYVGRHELHPVIDHDYCEFSSFNAEIQSGIILMSSETCARTDRLNLRRNKASLQTSSSVASTKIGHVKSADLGASCDRKPLTVQSQLDGKRKSVKRKYTVSPAAAPTIRVAKNAVGRPRLPGKSEKTQISGRKSNGYDSTDDLTSPPLTDDKNYVKIPGSFQNDFVYFATIRGRSSRKRHSEVKHSSQQMTSSSSTLSSQQKSATSGIKAFEWYKEMARTDKNSRFGANKIGINDHKGIDDKPLDTKLDISCLFNASFDEGRSLISESEVADLVMQMLPSSDVDKNAIYQNQFLTSNPTDSLSKLSSADVVASSDGQGLMDGIMDIGGIDLSTMTGELGGVLSSENRQNQQGFYSMDFHTITSSQLLEDISDSDLLMSSDIANMNALLNAFSDDQICGTVEPDGILNPMSSDGNLVDEMNERGVMSLLSRPDDKILEDGMIQQDCLTPPNSMADVPAGDLSFPCDLKEFDLNVDDERSETSDDRPDSSHVGDASTLLTPPPSLPPSSAPPELTTVNVFWNDLPGLLIEGREYVRLVDIHKQIMPAKDTGILKKRCIMLNLEVCSCSELQRDFLIRYMNAAKSKSKVIVAKETALALINFYVNPKAKSTTAHRTKETIGDVEYGAVEKETLATLSPPQSHSIQEEEEFSPQFPASENSPRLSESTKRSARLQHKRFSYLDMINNGVPLTYRFSGTNSTHGGLKQNAGARHFSGALKSESNERRRQTEFVGSRCDKKRPAHSPDDLRLPTTSEDEPQSDYKFDEKALDVESDNMIRSIDHCYAACPYDAAAAQAGSPSFFGCEPLSSSDVAHSEELMDGDSSSEISQEPSPESSTGLVLKGGEPGGNCLPVVTDPQTAGVERSVLKSDTEDSAECSEAGCGSLEEFSSALPSPPKQKSERVLRSSGGSCTTESTILIAKNNSAEVASTRPSISRATRAGRPDDEASNENRSPRLIRSKKKFLRSLTVQNNNMHKRHGDVSIQKEGEESSLPKKEFRGSTKIQQSSQSRPHRQARRKFDVLKF